MANPTGGVGSRDFQNGETIIGGINAKGAAAIDSMTDVGRQGVEALKPYLDQTDTAMLAANEAADRIHAAGDNVAESARALDPAIDAVRGDAASLRSEAEEARRRAQPWLDSSEDLLNMNRGAGGTTGEFWRLYDQLDPDLQMSLAASDARNETQAQTESAVRALTRAGVTPTAAAVASLRTKLANSTSALVTSVKTKARQAGVTLQMGALEKGLQMALQQSGAGEALLRDSVNAYASAAGAESEAGNLRVAQGDLFGKQGALEAQGGQLRLDAANTGVNAGSAIQRAYQAWGESFAVAAEWHSAQASSLLALLQRGAGSGNLARLTGGGASITLV